MNIDLKETYEGIGFIEEIATGRKTAIKMFGFTVLPVADGWLGISKYYCDSRLKRLIFMKQLGVFTVKDPADYKIGDKVRVKLSNKKITGVEVIGYLSIVDRLHPFWFYGVLSAITILVLSYFNVRIYA